MDKADISKSFKNYIPSNLNYSVIDFDYEDFDHKELKGKKFQVIVVDFESKFIPFLALKGGTGIRENSIYVRAGTESVEANQDQLEDLLNNRIESGYSSNRTSSLAEHLEQLRELMEASRRDGISSISMMRMFDQMGMDSMSEHYNFIEKMISKKKKIIEEIVST